MPAHGAYDVQAAGMEDTNGGVSKGVAASGKQSSRDTSYRACIHAMVIFVIFCIVLMLAAWPWGSKHAQDHPSNPNHNSSYEANIGHSSMSTSTSTQSSTTTETKDREPDDNDEPDVIDHTISTSTPSETTEMELIDRKPSSVVPDVEDLDEVVIEQQSSSSPSSTDTNTDIDMTSTENTMVEKPLLNEPESTVSNDNTGDVPLSKTSMTPETTNTDSDSTHPMITVSTEEPSVENPASKSSTIFQSEMPDTTIVTTDPMLLQSETAPTMQQSETTLISQQSVSETAPTMQHSETTLISQQSVSETSPTMQQSVTTPISQESKTTAMSQQADTTFQTDMVQNGQSTKSTDIETTALVDHQDTSTQQSNVHILTGDETSETTTQQDFAVQTDNNYEQQESDVSPQKLVDSREAKEQAAVTGAPETVCSSAKCKVLASRMLSLMNHSADACDDFYAYSCGGLTTNKALKEDNPDDDANTRIRAAIENIENDSCEAKKKFKKYYDSCLEYEQIPSKTKQKERINAVKEAVSRIGTFHTDSTWNPDSSNLTDLISRLMLHHSTPLFDITLDVDSNNRSKMAFKLAPGEFPSVFRKGVPRPDCVHPTDLVTNMKMYYEEYNNCTSIPSIEYMDKVKLVIKTLDVFKSLNESQLNTTLLGIETDIVWEVLQIENGQPEQKKLETGLRRIDLLSKNYEEMTVMMLEDHFSVIKWKVLFGNLLQLSAASISNDTKVQVYFRSDMEMMFAILKTSDERKLQNALLAMYAHDLYVDLIEVHDECTREDYCQHVATTLMPEVTSSLYLSSFRPGQLDAMRRDADELFELLRNTTEKQLTQRATWVDEMTKSDTVMKLKNMRMAVDGGASLFGEDKFLDECMDVVELSEPSYLKQSLALLARYRRQLYSLYNADPASVSVTWQQFLHPYSTSGVSIYSLNTIVIPYGLMTWPLYEDSMPRYLQMARLGFIIAHEMAHHFDSNGIMFRPGGSKGDSIISTDVEKVFESYKLCHKAKDGFGFKKSYAVDGRQVNVELNGDLSLNERLADDTATSLAWEAYKHWSPIFEPQLPWLEKDVRQLYFIALAQNFCTKSSILDHIVDLFEDEHLPASPRVHSFIRNSNDFAEAFHCVPKTNMNPDPEYKCPVFPIFPLVEYDEGNGMHPAPS